MKVVQGNYRQYQLVDKTRKKDIDGIRYLIAGERNLWAKLLRDKSETKKAEIYNLIPEMVLQDLRDQLNY